MNDSPRLPCQARGAALFVSLVLLLILTLLGLTSSNVSILQERMASNVRESNIALLRAEATLREIERQLSQGAITSGPSVNTWLGLGLDVNDCNLDELFANNWDSAPWLLDDAVTGNEYFIVELSAACKPRQSDSTNPFEGGPGGAAAGTADSYVITARAFSNDDATNERRAASILQSIYSVVPE